MVMVNVTQYGGRVGSILAAAAGAALLGTVLAPPDSVEAAFEELVRGERRRGIHGEDFDPDFDDVDLGDADDLGDAGDDAFG